MTDIVFDFVYGKWKVPEVRAFAKALGKMPAVAMRDVFAVVGQATIERTETFGEEKPPADWLAEAWQTFDVDLMAAFAWVVARREHPELSFEDFSAELVFGDLLSDFLLAVAGLFVTSEADEGPLSSGGTSESDSSSAPSSPGDSTTATNSPSKSGTVLWPTQSSSTPEDR